MIKEKETYETPLIEVIEISSKNSIATSGEGVAFWEES